MSRILAFAIALASALVCFDSQSVADEFEPFDPSKFTQVITLFDAVASYPPPSWQKTNDPINESEFFRDQNSVSFIQEQIPKNESFENWTKIYTVKAIHSRSIPFRDYIIQSVSVYETACGQENFKGKVIEKMNNAVLILILCENITIGIDHLGYRDGVGEIAVMFIGRFMNTTVTIHHSWRGDNFDANESDSWPVDESVVREMIDRFYTIKLSGKSSSSGN